MFLLKTLFFKFTCFCFFFVVAGSKLENIQFYMTIALIAVIILGAVMVMIGFIVNTVAHLLAEVSLFHL